MKHTAIPGIIKGKVKAPSSKSMIQRALAAALLSGSECEILNPAFCNDAKAALGIIKGLGAETVISDNRIIVNSSFSKNNSPKEKVLNCHEAGLSIRMFSPIASILNEKITLTGEGSLLTRPVDMIENTLKQLGVNCSTNNGLLPIDIAGPLKGGKAYVDGSISSQFLTGLLMALPLADNDSELIVENLKSIPYIDMTLKVLDSFNVVIENDNYERFFVPGNQKYSCSSYKVEGDWSGAAFLLVAGAVSGSIELTDLETNSTQADMAILKALEKAGAVIKMTDDTIAVKKSKLKAFDFDATHCPDLFPPLAALAANCKGVTRLRGAKRLVHKESSRAVTLEQEFSKIGIEINTDNDIMEITGGKIHSELTNSHNDHRIAMALGVAALNSSGPIIIDNYESINKSYPEFFNDLKYLMI